MLRASAAPSPNLAKQASACHGADSHTGHNPRSRIASPSFHPSQRPLPSAFERKRILGKTMVDVDGLAEIEIGEKVKGGKSSSKCECVCCYYVNCRCRVLIPPSSFLCAFSSTGSSFLTKLYCDRLDGMDNVRATWNFERWNGEKQRTYRTSPASSSESARVPRVLPVPSRIPCSSLASRRMSARGSSRATASSATNAHSRTSFRARAWPWIGATRRQPRSPLTQLLHLVLAHPLTLVIGGLSIRGIGRENARGRGMHRGGVGRSCPQECKATEAGRLASCSARQHQLVYHPLERDHHSL